MTSLPVPVRVINIYYLGTQPEYKSPYHFTSYMKTVPVPVLTVNFTVLFIVYFYFKDPCNYNIVYIFKEINQLKKRKTKEYPKIATNLSKQRQF